MKLAKYNDFRVLFVEDNPDVRQFYMNTLNVMNKSLELSSDDPQENIENFEPAHYLYEIVNKGDEAISLVKSAVNKNIPFAIVVIDLRLNHGISGIEAAEKIRQIDKRAFIIFTSKKADFSPEEILRRVPPADRFLYFKKPMHIDELSQLVRSLTSKWQLERHANDLQINLIEAIKTKDLSLIEQEEELKEHRDRSLSRQYIDEFTKLPNLSGMNRAFQSVLENYSNTLAVVIIKVIEFEKYKEVYGYEAANLVINELCERIHISIGPSLVIGRVSESELCAIIPNNKSEIDTFCQSIFSIALNPFIILRKRSHITVAIGASTYPDDGEKFSNLARNAAIAANIAMKQGRNHIERYDAIMDQDILDNIEMENALYNAIANNEFKLAFQPIVDADEKIFGAEVLLRWHHPELGVIPPDRFIPIAESSDLIVTAGNWVLETACKQARSWLNQHQKKMKFMFNISSIQLESRNFLPQMEEILEKYKISHKYVELEVTERIIIDNNININDTIEALKKKGINFSIDDFGTGYSALSYLLHFPFDVLKIDKSFVRDMSQSKRGEELIKAITALAHSLGINIVAEGIENESQFRFLKALGCHYFQGYYFSKPLDANEFEDKWLS